MKMPAHDIVPEPIAVVGVACRFPGGATSPARYWKMLWEGVDAIREVPADRWDVDAYFGADRAAPGKMNTRWGAFLDDVGGFDPAFFRISPREAVEMDPQQRLMLELAWEAFEDGGVDPADLCGSPIGVFVGAMWSDYARSVEGGTELIAQHTATGQDLSIIPGRISYTFGLEGPSLTVNTASSSSLVAVHLACQSLRAGESTAALAGGVNLILAPHSTVAMSKFGGTSPEGRCKPFDARGDGYGRGEGGGLVLLKPLSRALRDGDRIYCVIRGGAINNDGRSESLTAPSPRAQEAMLRAAYADAAVPPEDVRYVEAHGTGTPLGDPIEAGALGAVLGANRRADDALLVGSVKGNLGHLEAAAGIAGLIKAALALDHEALPGTVHFEQPNPHIDFEGLRLQVSARGAAWPDRGTPRVAGVSSFGFGGTNCHVILEEAPRSRARILALGAESEEVLQERARLVARRLGEPMPREALEALCRAAAEDADRPFRLAVTGASASAIGAALERAIAPHTPRSRVASARPRVVFVFPGQAEPWAGSGLRLMSSEPAFRRAIEGCDHAFRRLGGPSVIEALAAPGAWSRPEHGDVEQALLFSFQIGLAALWRSWGIAPDGVIRVGLGEAAAAHGAGLLSLEDAARSVASRRRWAEVPLDEAVDLALAAGPSIFVEIAPHPSLRASVQQRIATRGRSDAVLASCSRPRDERSSLLEAAGYLFTSGVPVALTEIYRDAERVALPWASDRPEADARPSPGERPLHVVTMSGLGDGALRDRARALREHLGAHPLRSIADVGYTVNARRGHLRERLALLAEDERDAAEALDAFLESGADPRVIEGPPGGAEPPRVAFVFPGQGPQHPGMGRALYHAEPVFRAALDRCAEILDGLLPRPLLSVMHPKDGDDLSLLDDTRCTQPALFAIGCALVELWRSWGIEPAAVLGHSMGELTAAYAAGVFSLEDGLKLAAARGRCMSELPAGGRMVFVRASEQRVAALVAAYADRVAIAAINGPEHTVISGAGEAVARIVDALRSEGVETTDIRVALASHSPLVAPMEEAFAAAAREISYQPPRVPLICNVTGASAGALVARPEYWVDQVRLPVRFGDGIAALSALGIDAVIEMGPHPILLGMGREGGRAESVRLWLPSLRRGSPDWSILLRSLGSLYTHGARIDWSAFDAPHPRRLVDVPTYPFQRTRFWLKSSRARVAPAAESAPAALGLASEAESAPAAPRLEPRTLVERLSAVEPALRRDALQAMLQAAAAKILGRATAGIPIDRPWRELGFDSLMAVELRKSVEALAGKSLPRTLTFDHPTVASLSVYLLQEVLPAPARAPAPALSHGPGDEPIAIVSMACRFPGGVTEPGELSSLLARRGDGITEIPRERWDVDAFYSADVGAPGKIGTRWGGFIAGIDRFDAAFFRVTPAEARSMDPHQRLLLEASLEALERAGEVRERLAESDTAVYIGISSSDFEARTLPTAHTAPRDPYGTTGRMRSGTAGRLSYWLGLRGPSMAVDTACSSSLVAVHLACQSLRSRECSLALAGGVHLMLSPENTIWLSQAGVLSPTGRCRSFDAAADGYVLSEGCGVLVLKRLVDAEAAGDPILAVIRGSAVNHDGQSDGFATPSGPAQRALLRRALAQAKISPHAVQYVEAHGTGTRIGDAIEARAIGEELGRGRPADRPLLIGSVKPSIGHTQAASGLAGVINVLLALDREEIPPTIHIEEPSPDVPWDELSLRVVTSATPWPREGSSRRVAGVSAFGMTGTNAHVILEEPPSRPRRAPPRAGLFLVPLSGRTEAALQETAQRLHRWVASHPEAAIRDIAYTAGVRRGHQAVRAGFLGADGASLLRAIEAFLRDEPSAAVITLRSFPPPSGGSREDPAMAAGRYVAGESVEFEALYPDGGEVVALPTTPLSRQRYWIDVDGAARSSEAEGPSGAVLGFGLVDMDAGSRLPSLLTFLREQLGEMLHLAPSAIPTEAGWVDLGMDSLRATELANRIRAALGLRLQAADVFRCPTLPDLAAHLATLSGAPKAAEEIDGAPAPLTARPTDSFEEGLI